MEKIEKQQEFNFLSFAEFLKTFESEKYYDIKSFASCGNKELKAKQKITNFRITDNEGSFNFCVDASKQLISASNLQQILDYLQNTNLIEVLAEMRNQKMINFTESRRVLHIAVRDLNNEIIDDAKINNNVNKVLLRMKEFVEKIHSGRLVGFSGKTFKYYVSIGIGGSDLGPKMTCQALCPFSTGKIECHFVSNIDATNLMQTLDKIDLSRTLFGINSKSFTTVETMRNALAIKKLLHQHFGSSSSEIVSKHFCAMTTNLEETKKFGIANDRVFEFWDWVGGRFSLWSSIGMPIIMQIGYANFKEFLVGGNIMDKHFFEAKICENIPIVLGIIKLWNLNVLKLQTEAILPYDQNLELFCPFLQQLESESNGKTFSKEGKRVPLSSTAVIFGQPGTNGQHAFYQMIHQGQLTIPSTFIFAREPANLGRFSATKKQIMLEQHRTLIANAIAQTEALMIGKDEKEVEKELQSKNVPMKSMQMLKFAKSFEGNRPTTSICIDSLTPHALGMLIALFEHQTYVTGILTGINSFDQFGVELGKKLALQVESELNTKKHSAHDSSTAQAIDFAARI